MEVISAIRDPKTESTAGGKFIINIETLCNCKEILDENIVIIRDYSL